MDASAKEAQNEHQRRIEELKLKQKEQEEKQEQFKLERQRIQQIKKEGNREAEGLARQTKNMKRVKDVMVQSLSIKDKEKRDKFIEQNL